MKHVSTSRHPHATIHKLLKLPTNFAGDDEARRSDMRLYLYIIKEELFVPQMSN